MTEERSGRAVPDTVPGQRAARLGKSLSGVAAIIAANLFGWLMWSLFSSPGRFGADPTPGYLWCACFAVLATASSVIAAIAHGRAMPGASVVATLAMWGLLPITVFFTVWLTLLYPVFAVLVFIFLTAPLLLAYAARLVIRHGRTARGTALLLVGLLYTVGVIALFAPALPLATWLPVMLWHLSLAVAAIAALGWDIRHSRTLMRINLPCRRLLVSEGRRITLNVSRNLVHGFQSPNSRQPHLRTERRVRGRLG